MDKLQMNSKINDLAFKVGRSALMTVAPSMEHELTLDEKVLITAALIRATISMVGALRGNPAMALRAFMHELVMQNPEIRPDYLEAQQAVGAMMADNDNEATIGFLGRPKHKYDLN